MINNWKIAPTKMLFYTNLRPTSLNGLMAIFTLASVYLLATLTPAIFAHHMVTQISLYYESICPDSRIFFLKHLYPTYKKLNRYMDVELVPFGKANVSYPRHDNKPEFFCHHGPRECYGNRVQACVIEMLKNTDLSIEYVHCMFKQDNWKDTASTAKYCANQQHLEWPRIEACVDGSEGERLLIANSLKTFNLTPELTYVPWIVFDKSHTDQMQKAAETSLLKYLCDNYFNHEPQIDQCKQADIPEQSATRSGANSLYQQRAMNIWPATFILAMIIMLMFTQQCLI